MVPGAPTEVTGGAQWSCHPSEMFLKYALLPSKYSIALLVTVKRRKIYLEYVNILRFASDF